MKRYLLFALIGPFVGGFLLLVATTSASGYWDQTNAAEIANLFVVFIKTLQYSYLFGVVPALMMAAIDDILFHVRRIKPVWRMLILGAIGLVLTELMYGSRGPDSGIVQFILYGLVGLVPAILSSWLSHRLADKPLAPQATS